MNQLAVAAQIVVFAASSLTNALQTAGAAFERKTGIPVLLNTSYNENEPIVNTPAEAIDCLQRTRMDVLAMGNFICRKKLES